MTKVEAAELNTIRIPRVADDMPKICTRTALGDIPFRHSPPCCHPISYFPSRGAGGELDIADSGGDHPMAVGLIRENVSGPAATRHALALRRHARALGYRYPYTVRPSEDTSDPIGYALAIAAGLDAAALVVYDLAAVDNRPARVCEAFDLETVCPPTTWARVAEPSWAGPDGPLAQSNQP
jgi:hypothetical protein